MSAADQLRDQIATALNVVQWLAVNGLKPLNQQAGNFAKPVILIESCGKCQLIRRRYGAEMIGRGVNEIGNYERWQADVNGCLVEWMEVAHG